MKVKSFKQYLAKRLNKTEIKEIEKAARIEFEILSIIQHDVANDLVVEVHVEPVAHVVGRDQRPLPRPTAQHGVRPHLVGLVPHLYAGLTHGADRPRPAGVLEHQEARPGNPRTVPALKRFTAPSHQQR